MRGREGNRLATSSLVGREGCFYQIRRVITLPANRRRTTQINQQGWTRLSAFRTRFGARKAA